MPPMPPITPVASTTMAAKKVVTEEENLKASTGIGCYFTSCFKKKIDPTSVTNQVSRTADVSLYPVMEQWERFRWKGVHGVRVVT